MEIREVRDLNPDVEIRFTYDEARALQSLALSLLDEVDSLEFSELEIDILSDFADGLPAGSEDEEDEDDEDDDC